MKKVNTITLKEKCNWRGIGTLVVITVCLVSVMSPAMPQSSLSLFNNASNATDGETGETPSPTPTLTPTPVPTPTPSPTLTSTPSPEPTPVPSPSPTSTPTPGPTPTLTPTPTPMPSPAKPNITSFAPLSPVHDTEGASRTFNITADQAVNVTWLLNGTEVQTTESVTEASYTNTSPAVGTWNVSAVATNENGTAMQTWIWNVSPQATPMPSPAPTPTPGPTPSPSPLTAPTPIQSLASNPAPSSTPIFIFGYLSYENGYPCNNSIVNVNEWQAETLSGYNYYQIVLANGTDINASEILQFNVTDDVGNTANYSHSIKQNDINNGIFHFDLTLPIDHCMDFTITNLTPSTFTPVFGDNVTITATIVNIGGNGSSNVTVRFYRDNKSFANRTVDVNVSGKSYNATVNWIANVTGRHSITAEVAPLNDTIMEINESNNNQTIQIFVNGTDLAITDLDVPCKVSPCFVDREVRMNVTIANLGAINATNFTLYLKVGTGEENTSGSVFFNKTFPGLNSGDNMSITVNWTPEKYGWYTITASIPHNYTDNNNTDNNNTNNEMWKEVPVFAEYEFAVDNVNVYPKSEVQEGEDVVIAATIRNLGISNGTVNVSFFVNSTDFVGSGDERFIEIGKNSTYLEVNKTNSTSISWSVNVTGGDHLIYAVVNPDNKLIEWPQCTHTLGKSILLKNQTLAGNNVKNCTLHVLKPDLKLKSLTLDPPKPAEGDLVNVSAAVNNEGNDKANGTVWFFMEKNIKRSFTSSNWFVTHPEQAEEIMMRAHLGSVRYHKSATVDASVDGKPVNLYVKSIDVADGQPIKVSQLNDSTPCHVCLSWDWEWNYDREEYEYICIDEKWVDVWTEWGYGNTLSVTGSFEMSKYQVRLGNRTVTLDAFQTGTYNVTWNTSTLKPGENYTLMANLEDEVVRNETFLDTTDLAVANLSVEKEVVLDDDQVWINATVENVGGKNASAFQVKFFEVYVPAHVPALCDIAGPNDVPPSPHNIFRLLNITDFDEGLNVGNSTNISVRWEGNPRIKDVQCSGSCLKGWSGDVSWIETAADDYTIRVELIPLENIEVEKGNNFKEAKVHVNRSRDFSITNLSFIVNNNETRAPDSYGVVNLELDDYVTLNATLNITNLVERGRTVNVSFYIDEVDAEHEIGNISTNFSVNETKNVEFNWTKVWNFRAVNVAGDHNMTVVVDPENKIHELNGSNNEYIQKIHVRAPELTVTNISFDPPELPEEGDIVRINVTIANCGDKNATNVALTVYDWADRHIENVANIEKYKGFPEIEVKRANATAMRLYLDLDIEGGEVCIYDSKGEQIKCHTDSFHGWTPWFLDSNIMVVTNGDAYAKVSKVYYLEESSEIDTRTIPVIECNKTANIPVNWTASPVGERLIAAIINPDIDIPEYNELNNTLTKYTSVQTADLIVSNPSLTINGTEIDENYTIKHGDAVNITANVTNVGIRPANGFNVCFFVDDVPLNTTFNSTCLNLTPKKSINNASAIWTAEVGTHVIKVEADYENVINETNETNNIAALEIYVHGAEAGGNTSLESLGLHGEILFDNKTQLYDEDRVNITVNITNYGLLNATDFNVLLFYNYTPEEFDKCVDWTTGEKWKKESYPDAKWVYLWIIDRARKEKKVEKWNPMDAGDVEVYDACGNAVLNETNFNDVCNWAQVMEGKSCWIPVPGDTANVRVNGEKDETFIIYFYPVYDYENETSRLFKGIDVPVNSSSGSNVSMNRTVSVGNYTVMAVIDPENRVPEDNKRDNIVTKEMEVLPTRDFTVTEVIPEHTNLSDADTINITANVTNVGYRNGTTEVRFLDYENETRMHKYYLNNSLPEFIVGDKQFTYREVEFLHLSDNLAYLPVLPGETLSEQEESLTVVHRPGVDAIQLHFDHNVTKYPEHSHLSLPPEIFIFNETGEVFSESYYHTGQNVSVWVQGETAYIYVWSGDFNLRGYTTMKVFHEQNVTLNASVEWDDESGNITAMRSESKNITTRWNASTGDHNVTVIMDPDDETSEINETNNTYVFPLRVNASKELEIVALNITPLHPTDGEEVNIRAVVQNKGNKTVNFTADLWMDTLKDSSFATVPNDWSITKGGKTRYISLLNHTELSLAPGEEANMTATWEDISVYGNPTYIVRAIVDPLDMIDEMNESNNENNTEIIMDYPDFTVAWFNAPTRNNNNTASVTIKNIGEDDASNVTVLLELTRHKLVGYTGITDITNITNTTALNITKEGASRIRVHFLKLGLISGNAFLVICDKDDNCRSIEEQPGGEPPPWVNGDTILIYYCGADFYIDEIEWGDEYNTAINLNASESVNVSLPKSPRNWNKYEGRASLNATVDPDDEIIEQREDNNNRNTIIYVDLVLNETKIEENKIKPIIWSDDTVENGIAFPVCNFSISLQKEYNSSYETIQTKWFNETIYGGEEREEVWFDIYECLDKYYFEANNKSNIKVRVDSEDEIEELDEGNNEKGTEIGPDIEIEGINVWPGYPVVGRHNCSINAILKNNGCLPAEDFVVNCSLDIRYLNETGGIELDNITLPSKLFSLDLNGTEEGTGILTFEWDPPRGNYTEHLPYYDVSRIKVVADTNNIVNELDETNNEKIRESSWRIYTETGYDANHPLETYAHNTEPINCGINYTIGDSYYLGGNYDSQYGPVHFNDVIPGGATVRLARLYLYWTWGHILIDDPLRPGTLKESPALLDVEVTFEGRTTRVFNTVPPDGNYTDLPTATVYDVAWGTYAYDVTDYIGNENEVTAIRNGPTLSDGRYSVAIAGMGLLVVYERDDLPLTTYWINEGADVLWMTAHTTGLTPEDCTTDAPFNGAADLDRVNATLWTIVPFGDGGDDMNRLFFNSDGEWHGVWHGSHRWPPGEGKQYVTDYLKPTDNKAELQDRNDCMMPSNAFLILTYPPDLEPSLEKAPPKVAVGNSYEIPVVIYNRGRSDARNFNVSFYVDGELINKNPVNIVNRESSLSPDLTFSWTAPYTPGTVEFKVVVDPDNDVEELINNNGGNRRDRNGESNVSNEVTKTVSVDLGGWDIRPGRGGGTGGGWGEGNGTDEGSGSGEGEGVAGGSGEGGAGESGGKTIRGRLMKGSVVSGKEAGGGGKGEFSLVRFLMQLVMLAAAVSLVFAGYLLERRKQTHKP